MKNLVGPAAGLDGRTDATFGLVVVLAVVAVLMWLLWAVAGVRAALWLIDVTGGDVARLGQVGDLFGGVNAGFAALACVGVFWAGYLQRHALLEARTALSVERAATGRQQFESVFFQVRISAHRGRHFRLIVDGISA